MISKKILLIIPSHNDQKIIKSNIAKVNSYLIKNIKSSYNIDLVVVENGSTDKTKHVCIQLKEKYKKIYFEFIKKKGRGNALKFIINKYDYDIYLYMDSDLATSLSSLKKLIELSLHNDLVIGSRYHKNSKFIRNPIRLYLSKGYNYLLKKVFKITFLDCQCGFKAFNKKVARNVAKDIKDNHWFFDSELIIKSYKKKYNVIELPIIWTESTKSTVNIFKDVLYYIFKIIELRLMLKNE